MAYEAIELEEVNLSNEENVKTLGETLCDIIADRLYESYMGGSADVDSLGVYNGYDEEGDEDVMFGDIEAIAYYKYDVSYQRGACISRGDYWHEPEYEDDECSITIKEIVLTYENEEGNEVELKVYEDEETKPTHYYDEADRDCDLDL